MNNLVNALTKTIGIFFVVAVVLFLAFNAYIYDEKQQETGSDYKNATYIVDGKRITLTNGVSEIEATSGSASKIITKVFGNEVLHDFNKDGREDIVFLLTQETGGSGTFFYVVGAVNTEEGFIGSQAVFLGDRIAPQSTHMSTNLRTPDVVVVNFAERAPGEPFSTPPSIGKSIWLKFDTESLQFSEVAQDFGGEADSSRMTLSMKTWNWIEALYNDGKKIVPKKEGVFTLSFDEKEKRVSIGTDCNSGSGSFSVNNGNITFGPIATTKMYCEGSQEGEFYKMISDSVSYHFTARGELILDLKFDSGSVIFK